MINQTTRAIGLIGNPVEHSLATFMHNAAFKHLGLNYVYLLFNVKKENLNKAIAGAEALNMVGFNVTIPHKIKVINKLDEFDLMANLMGAVNTIQFKDGKSKGFNTDGPGAIKAIEEVTDLKDKKVVILGSGGAARAVSFQIAISGINDLVILNRNAKKAKSLIYDTENLLKTDNFLENEDKNNYNINPNLHFNYGTTDSVEKELKDADILIDTTPVGMYPNNNEYPLATSEMMHSDLIVNDLVYNPIETTLLKEAKKAGAKTIPGTKMLIYQGAESFKIWTGVEAPIDIMEKAVLDKLTKKE
ncbi:shikimate dehydrogenase [Methanobrevibacter cuticularis]|uniref:Shikimate dehydrogenase (NADP(+)) n=1 Tax=Methanobrevibacter cuticularis TaxID=47311 RepID=A0A166CPM5_9EURY|nr:shikimate dehydrogenase [Methanobrevibacter cuticularis]KZX15867.1 shikimate dehydrogenase [Methanobrevibacter cuticularis]